MTIKTDLDAGLYYKKEQRAVSHLVQEYNGLYVVKKPLKSEEIIAIAKQVISAQFKRGVIVSDVEVAKDFFITSLSIYENEVFCAAFLDASNRMIAYEVLTTGSINHADVYGRDVLKKIFNHNAQKLIIAHNHPSGVARCSDSDMAVTEELKKLLKMVDVALLDHIIVGGSEAISLAQQGLLEGFGINK